MPIDTGLLKKNLEKEKESVDTYEETIPCANTDEVKDLLVNLKNQEEEHVEKLKGMISKLEEGKTDF